VTPRDRPLLSIITPIFNGEKYLSACIESVISQGCPDVEHIIVDGGSSDASVDIIRRYAAQHPQIRYLSEPDRGQSDAMNKGIAIASGDFVSFLNADDFYESGALRRVTDLLKAAGDKGRESLFLLGDCRILNGDGSLHSINRPGHLRRVLMLSGFGISRFPVNPAAYFYSKKLHERVGPYLTEEHEAMDLEFILRVLPVSCLRYLNEIWGNFRFCAGTKTYAVVHEGRLNAKIMTVLRSFHPTLSWQEKIVVLPLFYLRAALRWMLSRGKFVLSEPSRALARAKQILHGFAGVLPRSRQ
jgi:glycosyltransferase involved in cell wall biosynthesis